MVAGTAGLPVSPSVSDDRQERTSVPLSESLRGAKQYHDPVRPCRSLGMYAACPCPMPSSCRRWPPTFEKHRRQLRHNIGLEVLLYMSLTARMSTHPTRDVLRLIAHSRRAKTLLAYFLRLHLSRVLGHHYLAHAMVAQPLLHGYVYGSSKSYKVFLLGSMFPQ